MPRCALITGVNGQDGSYLAEFLLGQGYEVVGLDRGPVPESIPSLSRLSAHFVVDLMEPGAITSVLREVEPHEIYHLAAHHFSSQTNQNRVGSIEPFFRVNTHVVSDALEWIAAELPGARFFYPASAQVFGSPHSSPQDETTPRQPDTPYAVSKSAGMDLCRYFRHRRGAFASVGILYNHESPRRPTSFVTTQIAQAAARAASANPAPLVVRDLDAVVDWGAAEDYVRGIWMILQHREAGEYVIASGVGRTVRQFAVEAFSVVGLRAEDCVRQEGKSLPSSGVPLVGDSSKIRRECGWEPAISFERLVHSMVQAEIQRLKEVHAG